MKKSYQQSPNFSRGRTSKVTAIVDPKDKWRLEQGWSFDGKYFKKYFEKTIDGKRKRWVKYLHREVVNASDGQIVDHINGNSLDNRRQNLRIASKSLNAFNSDKAKGRSGIRNVVWSSQQDKWQVKMTLNGKTKHFGFYQNLKEASAVALKAKRELLNDV